MVADHLAPALAAAARGRQGVGKTLIKIAPASAYHFEKNFISCGVPTTLSAHLDILHNDDIPIVLLGSWGFWGLG